MLHKINQHKLVNQSLINSIGIIFLPDDPFLVKKQPFYLKKLCGLSLIERNIRILIKNGIRNIFILTNSTEDLNVGELDKNNNIRKIRSLDMIKDSLNQEKVSIKEIDYGIILDGGILIDERIISSLLNFKEDIIYVKGKNIETNCNNNQLKNLAGKLKINGKN